MFKLLCFEVFFICYNEFMSTVYFIGGAPRSGKTTVLSELVKQHPMLAASTDAIRGVVKGIQSPESNPTIFQVARGDFGSERHLELLNKDWDALLRSEIDAAAETWQSVLNFIAYYQRDGLDCAIEGVAVLPEQLAKVKFDYKAVFFVNLRDQTEIILSSARTNPEDWLGKYPDETIKLYSKFNLHWNQYCAEEASKYGFPIVEVDDTDFNDSVRKAVEKLLR
jgi:2-phosphoglycerate kinase